MSNENGPVILNVDDDAGGRYAVTRMLRKAGFQVLEAGTAKEALEHATRNPDLILLDVNLPDLSGFEVCRRIKENPATRFIPVMHLSATSVSNHDRTTGLDTGADAYLTHPVDELLLIATIRALLRAHRAETETRAAARAWQATFDVISHGVCVLNSEGRFMKVNRAMAETVGKTAKELEGLAFDHLLEGAEEPAGGWPFLRARESGHREAAEVRAGSHWYYVTADPILDEDSRLAGAVLTVVDITARKKSEEERERLLRQLENERARLEAVLRQMPAGVVIAEAPSGKMVLINEQVEIILRGSVEIGRGFQDYGKYAVFYPDGRRYRPENYPLARTLLTGEVITNEEIMVERGDRTRATILISSAPVRNREGFIVAGVAILLDVSERKTLEEQLRQSHKMEAVGRLAGGVAHDFNNLLTIIGGYGQMLLDTSPPDHPIKRDLEAIVEAAMRATELTRQLLTFSRRQMVQPRSINLNRQVTRMTRMLRRVIGEDVSLKTTLKAKGHIIADPAQVEQVILNIAVNARDAMPHGGTLTVETADIYTAENAEPSPSRLPSGRYLALVMTDTGVGMDTATQSHVFEPFFTTKAKGKGTGLGLATVYGIVKQSGGHIFIDSQVGRGTTLRIYFPLAAEAPPAKEVAVRPPEPGRGSETILVVEDEPEVRRLATEMLSRHGYRVLVAESGPQALALWQKEGAGISMLLTDVIMPQMSGAELAVRLRAERPELKVLYMSGYTDDVVTRHGRSDAPAPIIYKPFTMDGLVRRVRSVLDEKGAAE